MARINVNALPNITTPSTPVIFNPDICKGCNTCVNVCPVDVLIPSPTRGPIRSFCTRMSAGTAGFALWIVNIRERSGSTGPYSREGPGKTS